MELAQCPAGFAIQRNPGVTLLWTTKTYSLFDDGHGKPLIMIGDPEKVEWVSEGRTATPAEILQSIESGLPALMAVAQQEKGGVEYLLDTKTKFIEQWVPKESVL